METNSYIFFLELKTEEEINQVKKKMQVDENVRQSQIDGLDETFVKNLRG